MLERRKLPALDNARPLKKPDLPDIGNKNYTDTILRYGGLAIHFPQLETTSKTLVEAINELYHTPGGSTVVPNVPTTSTTPELTSLSIDGDVYAVSTIGELDDLEDVSISNPEQDQVITFDYGNQEWINDSPLVSFVDVDGVLPAGSTTLTLSSNEITENSTIDVCVPPEFITVAPTAMTVDNGSVTMTFKPQQSNVPIRVRIFKWHGLDV